MFLKRLELIGFKSFASKTVFDFEQGMTAIVGPNGCGKSNISDSIRWVLGEQSAKDLRGDLMEDVIFNGTVDAKPLGMAEVSLTIVDDKNALGLGLSEVVVTRRLFRSGESQYLINKKICRLRDVQDLFADTGIGTDAYSHIEQGKIDLILSSKPEERREIFEEAAGIMKYKRDKKTALRKLEATEDNLKRLNDIIREVKRQIISINRQAGKARRYKQLIEELSQIEVAVLVRNRNRMIEEDKGLRANHENARKTLETLSSEIETIEKKINGHRNHLQELELQNEKLQGRKLEILRNRDKEINNISLCEERIENTRNLDETARTQIEEIEAAIKSIEADILSRRRELEKTLAEKTFCEQQLAEKESDILSFSTLTGTTEEDLRNRSEQLMTIMKEEVQAQDELAALIIRMNEDKKNLNEILAELQSLAEKRNEIESQEKSLLDEKSSFDKRLIEIASKTGQLRNEIEIKKRNRNEVLSKIKALENRLTQVTSQHTLLRNMQENYEGYFSGVREVLKESKNGGTLSGIHGVVGDILTVEKGYEFAIEIALGNRIQNIITETGEAAEKAIAYLKKTRAGRATFLALDILKDTELPERELNELKSSEKGVLGCALNFVRHSEIYAPVARFLLSRTVIVQKLEDALNIARKKRYNFTLVTPEGEMISSRGAITGGSEPDSSRGLLMREAHINELAREKEELTNQISDLSECDHKTEQELTTLEREYEETAGSVTPLRDNLSDKEKELVRLSALRDSLAKQSLSLNTRAEEIRKRSQDFELKQTEIETRLQNLKLDRSRAESELENIRKAISGAEEKRAEMQKSLMELRVSNASLIERIGHLEASCKRLEEELSERKESVKRKKEEIESGKKHIEELEQNIEFIKKTIKTLDEDKIKTEKAIELVNEKRGEIVTSIQQLEDEMKNRRIQLKAAQDEESQLNIKLTELKYSISGIDDRLRNEYHTTADDPRIKQLPDETNWQEIESRIEELRAKKEEMGEVNLFAIEEEQRLQERYDILTEQQTDLINAKESLLKVISKINIEARKLFRETFDKIREEFKRRFIQLFGGGNADLILLDEHDVLESGIDIVASPPGKRLKSISLLSGGEKAMTAVSLLLAVFAVKPSPFCLLDEVDAPLDDSNIGRFMDILKEFLAHSQFIIITHNKRTMAMAQVLYGITMEKSGISKVVSVRFRERKDNSEKVLETIDLDGQDTTSDNSDNSVHQELEVQETKSRKDEIKNPVKVDEGFLFDKEPIDNNIGENNQNSNKSIES